VNVPLGAVLEEIVVLYIAPALPKPVANIAVMDPSFGYTATSAILPVGPGVLTHRFGLNDTIDGSASYMFGFQGSGGLAQAAAGLRIGYLPPPAPPSGFVAAAPIRRVLDTRVTGDPIQNNEERIVATGVPAHAAAAVINLTVTETEQAGFVAVFRADTTWPGNSSINWSSSGQNLANSVITATDPTGHIRIRGGVNSTHVVLDVQGYFA
jgi:hypothetical protein